MAALGQSQEEKENRRMNCIKYVSVVEFLVGPCIFRTGAVMAKSV
jgi:hypothetical protein